MYYGMMIFIGSVIVAHLIGGYLVSGLIFIGAGMMLLATMFAIWRLVGINERRSLVAGEACFSVVITIMLISVGAEIEFINSGVGIAFLIGSLLAVIYQGYALSSQKKPPG